MTPMSSAPAQTRARLVFDARELLYDFGHDHPFQARRLAALIDLLESSGLWHSSDERQSWPFRPASIEELSLIHLPEYLSAVQQLSLPQDHLGAPQQEQAKRAQLARKYGFAEGDTPAIAGMHEVAARIAGGTLVALSTVMGLEKGETGAPEERPLHLFHPAGGLHHAWAERASGFCIYNDAAVAIAHVLRSSEAKVLYLDFDAHHGDGVQRAFYDEPRVMTISLHETGRSLFPGSGDVLEFGQGLGRGSCVNLPLAPFTEDDSYCDGTEKLPALLCFRCEAAQPTMWVMAQRSG
jgi:acetoin utilization deacetylase AcuC-like enzyme